MMKEVERLSSFLVEYFAERPLLAGVAAIGAVLLFFWQRHGAAHTIPHSKPPSEFPRTDPDTVKALSRPGTRAHLVAMTAITRWDHQHIMLPLSHLPLWFGTQAALFTLVRNISSAAGAGAVLPQALAALLGAWGVAHDVPLGLLFAAHVVCAFAVSAVPHTWCIAAAAKTGPMLSCLPLFVLPAACNFAIVLSELPFHLFFQKSFPRPSPPMLDISKVHRPLLIIIHVSYSIIHPARTQSDYYTHLLSC